MSPSVSPSVSRSASPMLRDQGSSLYNRKVANTTEGGKRSADLTGQKDKQDEDKNKHGLREQGIRRDRTTMDSKDSADSTDSVDLIGSDEWKRGNREAMKGTGVNSCEESTDRVDCTRDNGVEKCVVEEREETKGEETCRDPIPDVSAEETGQDNEISESNVTESFDSTLRIFLVSLLISLLYFTLPLHSFIILLLAVFLFLLYGKQAEKMLS